VHAELRSTNVNSLHASDGGDGGANGGSTSSSLLNNEVLDRDSSSVSNFSDDGRSGSISGVSLVAVSLKNDSFVDSRGVLALVLGGIVGVLSMSHISRNKERSLDSSHIIFFLIFYGDSLGKFSVNSLQDIVGEGRGGSLSRN